MNTIPLTTAPITTFNTPIINPTIAPSSFAVQTNNFGYDSRGGANFKPSLVIKDPLSNPFNNQPSYNIGQPSYDATGIRR